MAIGWQLSTHPTYLSSSATIDSGELGLALEHLPRIGLRENQWGPIKGTPDPSVLGERWPS